MNPIILAIDTATDRMTVVLSRGKEILVDESVVERHHSRMLLQVVDNCLRKAKLTNTDIDAFSTTIGPGSFTGIRTSLGTIKGLAYVASKPVIGIPTLYAMAYPCLEYGSVAPVLDARKGFVYTAVFENKENQWTQTLPAAMISIETFTKNIPSSATIIGSASRRYFKENPEFFSPSAKFGNSKFDFVCGTTLCEISLKKYLHKEFEDVFSLEPLYIQKTAAEGYA